MATVFVGGAFIDVLKASQRLTSKTTMVSKSARPLSTSASKLLKARASV
jgi:hypothetical protein